MKLYVRRVFITDEAPTCCRPICASCSGVVDTEDLPLNVSREMLQTNPMLARIRAGARSSRVLTELEEGQGRAEDYAKFWDNFGAVLKEGIYEDPEQRDDAAGAGALPLDRARRAGLARRLRRPR